MSTQSDAQAQALIASWRDNAERWTEAVRSGSIASRRLVTDDAIIRAVLRHRPSRVLDLGCGEGWLARALATHVAQVIGADAAPELVARAEGLGGASFYCASYADVIAEPQRLGNDFGVIVANFSLLDADLKPLLAALRSIASPAGALIVQTLHPSGAEPPYESGWRDECFAGFGATAGWSRMPWYFRTLGAWIEDVAASWRIICIEEPLHPDTRRPLSLIITADAR